MRASLCCVFLAAACSKILAETNSYDDRNSAVTWRDFVKFVDDVYSQSNEKKRQHQDQEPVWNRDLFPEYDQRKRNQEGKSDEFLFDSNANNDEAVEGFLYDSLADSKYDVNPQPTVLTDAEYDDIAQVLQSEDGRQELLAVALLEDMIDNAKEVASQSEFQDDITVDQFSHKREDEFNKEDDFKIVDKASDFVSPDEANSEEDDVKSTTDTILSKEEDTETSDGKKERGQNQDQTSEEVKKDVSEEKTTDISGPVAANDEDELRSLITEMTKSENAEDAGVGQAVGNTGDEIKIDLQFPGISVNEDDTYLCTATKIDDFTHSYNKPIYITKYAPHAKATVAHHMLLYGCSSPGISKAGTVWNCGGQMEGSKKGKFPVASLCGGGQSTILWAWAKNAPTFTLPKDIGFKVGSGTNTKYLVLQVHYKSASVFRGGMKDHSGVVISATKKPQDKLAGVYILASTLGTVEPRQTTNFDIECKYSQPFSMHPFAFRTHTHALGVEVIGFRIRDKEWTLIGAKSPQLPEAFYPVATKNMTIRYGDLMAARCVMHNFRNVPTSIGWRHTDEMCNFYIMFWTPSRYEKQLDSWSNSCNNGFPWVHWSSLPGFSI